MDCTYKLLGKDLTELLVKIEEFEESMVKLIDKYPGYKYTIAIEPTTNNTEHSWAVDVNVIKDEQTDIKNT